MSKFNRRTFLSCLHADLCEWESADKKSPFFSFESVAATQLRESIFKKLEDPNPQADAKAIDKFRAVNERCGSYKLAALSSWDEEVVGSVKRLIDDFLHPDGMPLIDSYDHIFRNGATGPGASIVGRGGDFFTKMFSSELSATSLSLYKTYSASLSALSSWREAECFRFSKFNGVKLVEGNRLSCVPKNVDISRTICTEPTLNMWYQLGCGNILTARLRQFFRIDLSSVWDMNRRMAFLGSGDASNSFSTIDLESASDSISLGLLDVLFPKWFSGILQDLRSPVSRLPDGSTLEMKMVSTMGNGFTFPLQTLIFASVVSAVYSQLGIPQRVKGSEIPEWSVFGDDIVVRRKAYSRVIHVLGLLGFHANAEKSFSEGPFRESCGADFYKGRFVRGVYIRRLDGPQDVFLAFNKLVRWSSNTGIALPCTMQFLLKQARFNPVPVWEADDAGFKVPHWWTGVETLKRKNGMYAYKVYAPRPRAMRLTDDTIVVPRGQRGRVYNPNGLVVSITRGDWVGGTSPIRQGRSRNIVQVRRRCHSWYQPPLPGDAERYLLDGVGRQTFLSLVRCASVTKVAVGPIAGPVDGKQWNTAFYSLRK